MDAAEADAAEDDRTVKDGGPAWIMDGGSEVSVQGAWVHVLGCAQSITASTDKVWIVGCHGLGDASADGPVFVFNPGQGSWTPITPTTSSVATQVGASAVDKVWVINKAGIVGEVSGDAVTFLDSGVADLFGLAVDPYDDVFVHDQYSNVSAWTGAGWRTFQEPGVVPSVNGVAYFNGGPLWLVVTTVMGTVFTVTDASGPNVYWKQIGGSDATLIADHVVLMGGAIQVYDDDQDAGSPWTALAAPPVSPDQVVQIANMHVPASAGVHLSDTPWLIGKAGSIYRWQR